MRGVGLGGGALSALKATAMAQSQAAKVAGPGKTPITLQVNGKRHDLNVEPRVTLLDALRDHLGYTGAKKVCDRGACGSCTVLVAGKPVYACNILAIEAQDQDIRTIEGLSDGGKIDPVVNAFVQNDALQCGFCTPGFVMAVTAFLQQNPDPTEEQIKAGLGGNICRCGTYMGIRKAVLQAAAELKGASHA